MEFIFVSEDGCRLECSTWRGGRGVREECATLAVKGGESLCVCGWVGAGVVVGLREEVCGNRLPEHGLPLSLYLRWGFCSTVANTEGLTLDWGHRCQEHISTCSTTVSCFAITIQIVLIFLHFLWRIWIKFLFSFSPVLLTVSIIRKYTTNDTIMYNSYYDPWLFFGGDQRWQ